MIYSRSTVSAMCLHVKLQVKIWEIWRFSVIRKIDNKIKFLLPNAIITGGIYYITNILVFKYENETSTCFFIEPGMMLCRNLPTVSSILRIFPLIISVVLKFIKNLPIILTTYCTYTRSLIKCGTAALHNDFSLLNFIEIISDGYFRNRYVSKCGKTLNALNLAKSGRNKHILNYLQN